MDRGAFRSLVVAAWAPVAPYILLRGREKYAAVIESWATGVEWQFAMGRYRNHFRMANYEYESNEQDEKIAPFNARDNDLIYTSIVVDMIDNCNQRDACNRFSTANNTNQFPQDRVSGYTIRQVEQGLRGARSWNAWRNNMRDRYHNGTEGFLNELFANWY